MEYAYTYRAKNAANKIVKGIVYAPNKPLGFARLTRNGLQPIELSFNTTESISNAFRSEFPPKELSRFYATLGRRVKNGKSMQEGLEASVDYVKDNKLRMSILVMKQKLADGSPVHIAMESAGFPTRDSLALKTAAAGASIGDQFIGLAKEINRVTSLRNSITSIFRMPLIMIFIMYIFLYFAITKAAPMTVAFLKETHLKIKLPLFNQLYFDFAKFFNDNIGVTFFIYWSIPVLLYYAVKSTWFKTLINKIPLVRNMSVKADMAALWTSFGILYNANAPIKESCRIVAAAAKREDSKRAFNEMAALINTGQSLGDAVMKAGFPEDIKRNVYACATSGNMVEGLNELAADLEEDVEVLTSFLQDNIKLLSMFVMALGLLILFYVTYFPIVSSVMSNL